MENTKAIYYGQVELIPGVTCDGYVLDDGTAVMSERGAADLLQMDHKSLRNMWKNWPPKSLEQFVDSNFNVGATTTSEEDDGLAGRDLSVGATSVEVAAKNSPHKGRKIVVYSSSTIETIIRAYVMASGHNTLQKNQLHIGRRCSTLVCALIRTALDTAIKEACGLPINIQQTAQQNYIDAVKIVKEFGFTCSVPNNIATKKDIVKFLNVPESTLNSFLRKHKNDIKPIKLNRETILSIGRKAPRLNGYCLDDITKISLGMDTVVGIKLKRKLFGNIGGFVKPNASVEVQWREVLSEVFQGLGLHFNYPIGKYKVDFFVEKLMLVLECNGYDHRYYNLEEEKERERLITQKYSLVRFPHKVSLETLFNGILQAKAGTIVKLYEFGKVNKGKPLNMSA